VKETDEKKTENQPGNIDIPPDSHYTSKTMYQSQKGELTSWYWKNQIYYLGRISCSPLALRTWGLAGVLLPDLTTSSFLLFFSIWSESTDELTAEVFVSSLLLRFTEPILEKLVSKVWLEDIGVLHDTASSNDKGKKVGKEKWTMCMLWSLTKIQSHT